MSEKIEIQEPPKHIPGARYAIDPVAFAIALIGAPLLVALLFFWILLIPVFALLFGGIPYLVLGTPVLLIYLHYSHGSPQGAAGLAALTACIAGVLYTLWLAQKGDHMLQTGIVMLVLTCCLHGAAWGWTFGLIYNHSRSDASRQPLPSFPQ